MPTRVLKKIVENNPEIKNTRVRAGTHLTPCHPNLLRDHSSTEKGDTLLLSKKDQTLFASRLMSAMFPAKRTRHDILMPLSALAMRLQKATQEDMDALTHVYVYISLTLDLGLTFHTQSMQLHYWIDAAYALHSDKRGHTGILVHLPG